MTSGDPQLLSPLKEMQTLSLHRQHCVDSINSSLSYCRDSKLGLRVSVQSWRVQACRPRIDWQLPLRRQHDAGRMRPQGGATCRAGANLRVGHRGNQRVLGGVMISHQEAGRTHALSLVSQQVTAPSFCVVGYDKTYAQHPTSQPAIIPPPNHSILNVEFMSTCTATCSEKASQESASPEAYR